GRRGDVHDIRRGVRQQLTHIAEVSRDGESLRELPGHQRLAIADGDDVAPLYPADLRRVRVGDFSAPDDPDPKHARVSLDNFENTGRTPPPSARAASSRAAS